MLTRYIWHRHVVLSPRPGLELTIWPSYMHKIRRNGSENKPRQIRSLQL